MHPVQKAIIQTLSKEATWITSNTLALQLEVSSRSIKKYIAELNAMYDNLIISSKKGYRINEDFDFSILENSQTKNNVPQTKEERINYILKKLILSNNQKESIDMYTLEEELFISESTLRNDIQNANGFLKKYQCSIEVEHHKLSIVGEEKMKRKVISDMVLFESSSDFNSLSYLEEFFPNGDIDFVKETIISTFQKYRYFVNDFSLSSLIRHAAISITRLQNTNHSDDNVPSQVSDTKEFIMAQEITKAFEKHFHLHFNYNDIYELSLLILCRGSYLDPSKLNTPDIQQLIPIKIREFMEVLLRRLDKYYYINLSDQEFLNRFMIHIDNVITRSKYDLQSRNPLTETMKKQYPFIYEVSVFISNQIATYFDVTMNDDEIAYIVMHIGGILSAQKTRENMITCSLIFPNYSDLNTNLLEALNAHFKDTLIITSLSSQVQNIDTQSDIVLSISNSSVIDNPYFLEISPFLTQQDILNIQALILRKREDLNRQYFRTLLTSVFDEALFFTNTTFHDYKETLQFLSEQLIKQKFVKPDFLEFLMKREDMSSTAYGNFAIPHSIEMNAIQTKISVLIQKNPIAWKEKEVYYVFLVSIAKNDIQTFKAIFEKVTDVLSLPENLQLFSKCKTYDEFISAFMKVY